MDLCKANTIKTEFEKLTGIDVRMSVMNQGDEHNPSPLPTGRCGVYVFFNDKCCFKVGKAGGKSKARWNSQHYNLDGKTPSTLPKSLMKHKDQLKEQYPSEKHPEIDALSKENIQEWIRNNMSRIELLIPDSSQQDFGNNFSLGLLEALAQFHLRPIFEGKNA